MSIQRGLSTSSPDLLITSFQSCQAPDYPAKSLATARESVSGHIWPSLSLSEQSGQLVSLPEALPLSPQAPLGLLDQMAEMAVQFAQCGPDAEGSGQCELSRGHYP